MVEVLIGLSIAVVFCFGFVVLAGAPYLPSFRSQIEQAIEMLELKAGDTVIDLGSGDGKVMKIMAENGIRSIGYELNPILYLISRVRLWPHRQLTDVRLGNYMKDELPSSSAVFIFGYQTFMKKVEQKLLNEAKGRRVVSSIFPLPKSKPVAVKDGLYLYHL